MPELPEVEGTRRWLVPHVVGRRVEQMEVRDRKLWHAAAGLSERDVDGRAVGALERRAKLFIFALEGDLALLLHLKIAGQIAYVFADGTRLVGGHPYPLPGANLPDGSTRFVLYLGGGDVLFVNDQRRFSWLRLLPASEVTSFIAAQKYGPDPLAQDFTADVLGHRLQARQGRPVKAALLDQTCVAGLGNIYADEALHRARIHPTTRAGTLSPEAVTRLHQGILDVLAVAVPVAGAVVKSGRAVDEAETGRDFLRVHGLAGEPCPNCDGGAAAEPPRIVRTVLAGRGTYFCPTCQPEP